MFKKTALAVGMLAMIAAPSIVSARDRDDDYRYGRGYYSDRGDRRDHEWRERERRREHERHEWLERQNRERSRRYYNNQYYNGYSNNGYNGNGYYDNYGNWHPYR
jgi:hypothetical protein